MKYILPVVFFAGSLQYAFAQSYSLPTSGVAGPVFTCSGFVYDNGGAAGNYSNNCNGGYIIGPSIPTDYLNFSGTWALNDQWDSVLIYEGQTSTGPWGTIPTHTLVGPGTGTINISTSVQNYCFKIILKSNGAGVAAGLNLTVSCIQCQQIAGAPVNLTLDTLIGTSTAVMSWNAGSPQGYIPIGYYWILTTSASDRWGGGHVFSSGSFLNQYATNISVTATGLVCGQSACFRVTAVACSTNPPATNPNPTDTSHWVSYCFNLNAITPTQARTSSNNICSNAGGTISLSATGGWGSALAWSSASCSGILLGTCIGDGNPLVIPQPTITTTYWAQWQVGNPGSCPGSNCKSVIVTILPSPGNPTSASVSNTNFCFGAVPTISLSTTGGGGTSFNWSTGSCFGTTIGATNPLTLTPPTVTTTYWVNNVISPCPSQTCASVTITIIPASTTPGGLSANPSPVCAGTNSTLSLSTGFLGAGADWYWYSGSCGGTGMGTGTTAITQLLTTTTTFWVRGEGTCNTTPCAIITLSTYAAPVAPTSVASSNNNFCTGSGPITLTSSGGSGTFVEWNNTSCGVGSVGNGNPITINPSPVISTTYWANWYIAGCNNSTCSSIYINVLQGSSPATSITASPPIVCSGTSFTLTLAGGSLGSAASWHWYTGSCGGTSIGAPGTTLTQSATASIIYWVRAEGTCGSTTCVSVTEIISTNSTPATSITSSLSPICLGTQSSTLGVSGGTLGIGATWHWYSGSCGGVSQGSGLNITVSPTINTVYYVRAEGACFSTSCVSSTVQVTQNSTVTSVSASPPSVCPGITSTLSVTGNIYGTGTWAWYSVSCGGSHLGTGTSLPQTPAVTTTYWVRAETNCMTTNCLPITISINTLSAAPTAITAAPNDSACAGGGATTLTVTGGSLGTGGNWKWYKASCGGTLVAPSGTNYNTTPPSTTVYWVRAEGSCNTTGCASITITVLNVSSPPTSASALSGTPPGTVCSGAATLLQETGGTLGDAAYWYWYTGSCGGTYVLSSLNQTVTVNPTISATYYIQAAGFCNPTNCLTVNITVNTLSAAASSAFATPSTICPGSSSTLSLNGGNLGTGAVWKWYTSSCGGAIVSSGISGSITVSPVITTIYFVRAMGTCNTTACVSVAVSLFTNSVQATTATASPAGGICPGSSVSLSATGGTLGTNAAWNWSTGSCGGTNVGTGVTQVVQPLVTTTYYVNAAGLCNTTACVTVTVNILTVSVIPDSASSSPDTLCSPVPGGSSTLSLNGGSIGTGANWYWYTGSCASTLAGSGFLRIVSPATTTTYWVRASGTCNTTFCVSISVTVNSSSTAATSVTANPGTTICAGNSLVLTESGGSTGTSGNWAWYSGFCGGFPVGTGISVILTPAANTTYFVRAEAYCNTTLCISKTITVNTLSDTADSATGTPDIICTGASSTLSIYGGGLGTGASWKWYTVSCGGTLAGIGITLPVTPAITTIYFVRAEGTCNTTPCVSLAVTVFSASSPPATATGAPSVICTGQSSVLGITGGLLGTGATWDWYSVSCGGLYVTSGIPSVVSPLFTTTYFIRAEGLCNTTTCVTLTITVNFLSVDADSAVAVPQVICTGDTSMINVSGGILGTNANWDWYTGGSCGGTYIGSGISRMVIPAVTTTYYVNAQGICNTTTCESITVTLIPFSLPASSATATPNFLLVGQSMTLSLAGGFLNSVSNWYWYFGGCGTGASVGTGSSITISPLFTGTYYVRAEGTCNTTTCVSVSIVVNNPSTPPDSSTSSNSFICSGDSVALLVWGGSTGSLANWYWYTGSCGGTLIHTGAPLIFNHIQASNTNTYWVRAEGPGVNTTTCASVTITVNTTSSSAVSAIATPPTICPGHQVMLTQAGGSIGTGSAWYWYAGSCGGTFEGTGSSLTVIPPGTTSIVYYIRAEGFCNTTSCVSTTVILNTISTPATSASSSPGAICPGSSSTLTFTGGNLGTGASWMWYSGSCGGTFEGSGISISVSPLLTTTYYLLASGICDTTLCVSTVVTLNIVSTSATLATASPSPVCPGLSSTISASGGNLGTAADWYWFSGSCGSGVFEGNGSSLIVSPSVVTIYFVRAEGLCNTTGCISVTLSVDTNSIGPVSAYALPANICANTSAVLHEAGGLAGTGASWHWYTGSCGGTLVGSTHADTLIINIGPSVTTLYFVRAEGLCNNTNCQSFWITVTPQAVTPLSATPDTNNLCSNSGYALSLIVSGGSGAYPQWYTSSCGGTSIGTGAVLGITYPTSQTIYWVRWITPGCTSSGCVSFEVFVVAAPTSPLSGISDTNNICIAYSNNILLSVAGGSGSQVGWYTGGCSTTYIGSGNPIAVVPPGVNTTYWANWQVAGCPSTTCVTINLIYIANSTPAISAAASLSPVCPGQVSTLSLTPGSLGNGASWYWYSGACGGVSFATGLSVSVSPTVTTIYYVLAQGICNTTSCVSVTVDFNSNSIVPSSASVNPSVICPGQVSTLTVNGGTLGAGSTWNWYTGSCGGISAGAGSTLNVTPTSVTIYSITYWVRAEGICNTTACISVTLTLDTTSLLPVTATAYLGNICGWVPDSLTEVGGLSGTGAEWYWYTGSCGGSLIGSSYYHSMYINPGPSITTTYYVMAIGLCNTTTCVTTTIIVTPAPTDPLSAAPDTNSICSNYGGNLFLITSGGSGAFPQWYTGNCQGTIIGTGTPFQLTPVPSTNTTYWVNWLTPGCTASTCVSVSVFIVNAPVTPITASSDTNNLCSSFIGNIFLSVAGGSGTTLVWYTVSCNGTVAGTGNNLPVPPPLSTTTYWATWQTPGCTNNTCVSITITILLNPVAPVSVSADSNNFCTNFAGHDTLTVTGGSGTTLDWYTGSCSGTIIGTGTLFDLFPAPLTTTTYYCNWVNICGASTCQSITIDVQPGPVPPVSAATDRDFFCTNDPGNISLSASGGSGASVAWYTQSCGGTSAGAGNPNLVPSPTVTTTYYVCWTTLVCGNSNCISLTVSVVPLPLAPVSVSSDTNNFCYSAGITSISLSTSGGSYGTTLDWYISGCSGTFIGTGTTFVLTGVSVPTVTTTYWASWENSACGNSACISFTIAVWASPTAADSAIASPSSLCFGSSSILNLSVAGGYGTTVSWFTGNCGGFAPGTSVGTGNPLSTVPPPPATTVYYARWETSCSNSTCVSVTVFILPLPAPVIHSNSPVCSGGTIILTDLASSGVSYLWSGPNSYLSGSVSPHILNAMVINTGLYQVTVTDINNCSDTSSVYVQVFPYPTVVVSSNSPSVGPGSGQICEGDTLILLASGTSGSTYAWSGPLGFSSTTQNDTIYNALSIASGTYTVTVTNPGGCSVTASTSVTIKPIPQVNLPPVVDKCALDNFWVTAHGGGTYQWTGPNGFTSTQSTIFFTMATAANSGTYFVTVTGLNQCSATSSTIVNVVTITVNPSYSPSAACTGNMIHLLANPLPPGVNYSYTWNGPQFFTSNQRNPLVNNLSPANTGTYSVTVTDTLYHCTASASTYVNVYLSPPAPVTSGIDTLCAGDTIKLNAMVSPNTGYYIWSGPNGMIYPVQNPRILAANSGYSGTYLVVFTDNNGCTSSSFFDVTVNSKPIISIDSISPFSFCYGYNLILSATSNNGTSYQWNGPNGFTSNLPVNTISLPTPAYSGTYFINVSNADGCNTLDSIHVAITQALYVSSFPDTSLCNGKSMGLIAHSSGGVQPNHFFWNQVAGDSSIIIHPTVTTTYAVYARDKNGCMSNIDSVNVSVNPGVKLSLSTAKDTICPNSAIVINASITLGNGGPYYTYFPNGTYVPFPLTVYPDSTHTYVVLARDTCGSIGTDSLKIVVLTYPPRTFTSNVSSGCQPLMVYFNEPNPDNGLSYLWDFGDGSSFSTDKNPDHLYTDFGNYNVTLKVISSHGCPFNYLHNDMITVHPKPIASFGAFPSVATINNPAILFNNSSLNGLKYYWNFGTGDSSNLFSPVYSYTIPGVYNVKLVVQSLYGCLDSLESSVIIEDLYTFFAPNAISPDNNGLNDTFYVYGHGIDPDNFQMYIYDRWGEVLFKSSDITKGWNGKYKNSVIEGTFTWLVIYKDLDGVEHKKNGKVTVIK